MDSLNTLDLGIIAVIGISAIFGITRGFVREAMSLVTWIIALFVATVYCTTVSNYLTVVSLISLRYLIAFLLLVLLVLMIGGLISHSISKLIHATGFTVTDRIVGALFGVMRGVLIVAIAVLLTANVTFAQQNPLFQKSILMPHFKPLADWIKATLPEDFMHKILGPNVEGTKQEHPGTKQEHPKKS